MEIKRIDEVKIEDIDIPRVTLKQVINKMKFLTEKGYNCYIEGRGNGAINLVFIKTKKMSVKKHAKK